MANTISETQTESLNICTKAVLTSKEAAMYLGIKPSYLYKLTMRGVLPHYKPLGKMNYFKREELEDWLQRNRVSTAAELEAAAKHHKTRRVDNRTSKINQRNEN